ncbi:MAG: YtxH domain-containing protein [Anaerolineae bacterium]
MAFLRWAFGLAVGFGIGWVAGRLLAPQSGEMTRRALQERYRAIATEAAKAAEQKRTELEARYELAKRSGQLDAKT